MFRKFFKRFDSSDLVILNNEAVELPLREDAFVRYFEDVTGSSLQFKMDEVTNMLDFVEQEFLNKLIQYNTKITSCNFGLPVRFINRVKNKDSTNLREALGCDEDAHTFLFYVELLERMDYLVSRPVEQFLVRQLAFVLARDVNQTIEYNGEAVWSPSDLVYYQLLKIATTDEVMV